MERDTRSAAESDIEMQAVSLSVAMMHHPSRSDRISDIITRSAPLSVRVVTDPDPDGVPSPLRTAKLAWIPPEGSTHHMVIQDDIVPAAGFADAVMNLIRARPNAVIALSTNRDSPCNSWQVRCAAAGGQPYANLAPWEWVPFLALVMPVEHARGLAEHLRDLPVASKSDDLATSQYMRDHRIQVIAPIPHLVDHGEAGSVAGNEDEGRRGTTVFCEPPAIPAPDWQPFADLSERDLAGDASDYMYTITLQGSRCVIDTPLAEDEYWPAERRWRRWAPWVERIDFFGLTTSEVLYARPALRDTSLGVPESVAIEVWAAGFLLGYDAARRRWAMPEGSATDTFTAAAIEGIRTWIDAGIVNATPAALSAETANALVHHCVEAARRGRTHWRDTTARGNFPAASRTVDH